MAFPERLPVDTKTPPEPDPDEAQHLIEPAPTTEFLVTYEVSGCMLVSAADFQEAHRKAAASLQATLEKPATPLRLPGGNEVELSEPNVEIVAVQSLEFFQELPDISESESP